VGQTTTITVNGVNTTFNQGTTTVDGGIDVTVGTITVASPTTLTVQLTVAVNATPGAAYDPGEDGNRGSGCCPTG
jgi:hypothetical protein